MRNVVIIFSIIGFFMISCLDYERHEIPGYAAIYFISEEVKQDKNDLKATFSYNSFSKSFLLLDLTLENIGNNNTQLSDRYLKNVKIFDKGIEIDLIELFKGIEIEIKGKKTVIKISYDDVIKENTNFSIFTPGDKFLSIFMSSFQLQRGKYEIEIKAPNINLQTWKVKFVIGNGETGSL